MILLDTNIISESMRPNPDSAVLRWLDSLVRSETWTCSIVVGELFSGVDLMPAGRKSRALRFEIERALSEDFNGQVLDFDIDAARHYGAIVANRNRIGRPIRELDAEIAAIAASHGAAVATRNIRDFEGCGVKLINPWQKP
ncbi:MAG TPA: type II toxin-antitoxin system VapC family toxin [Terracidiphilus sp.]|nr:type II toxin-antitoxin system VapC family toxin [Terracidiphilus sp.]